MTRRPLAALLALLFVGLPSRAAQESSPVPPTLTLPALPSPLVVVNHPTEIRTTADGGLFIAAPGKTNLFNSPEQMRALRQ